MYLLLLAWINCCWLFETPKRSSAITLKTSQTFDFAFESNFPAWQPYKCNFCSLLDLMFCVSSKLLDKNMHSNPVQTRPVAKLCTFPNSLWASLKRLFMSLVNASHSIIPLAFRLFVLKVIQTNSSGSSSSNNSNNNNNNNNQNNKPNNSNNKSINNNDDVIKWKHFPRYWPFVWGVHRSPVVACCCLVMVIFTHTQNYWH